MMSFKEFKASVNTAKVAGPPQQPTTSKHLTNIAKETPKIVSPTPSTSSTMSSTFQEPSNMKMGKLFTFIDDAYRDIRRLHSGFRKDSYNNHLMQTINKYKNGCNRIFEEVLESHEMSKKLAQNIVRTIDIFKELCTSLTDLEEYQHRVCEMMAIFIACELRLSVDTTTQEQLLIGQRIVYIMRRHLVQEIEEDTRYNILRTLVYIPRLFNARDIMCAIFGQFIPMKPVVDVNVLSDRLYMLYIIVFYRWMMMQKDDDDKLLIVNFAESFMKPSVTLCTNQLYAKHLPRYTTHSTATRTILNNMKFYRDIRNASIIDNALKKIGPIVDLCDDDEDADLIILDTSNSTEFAEIFSSVQLESLDNSMTHIKLEEKTIIGTVDLTLEEEESTNSPKSICEIHDKWLNNFQQLAKQYRESQIIIERKQNSQQISNNQKDVIISLDSDSESDEDISTTTSNVKQSMSTTIENNENSNSLVEELFVDNYPPTVTPINCGTDLESSDVEDDDDVTKLSSRFLSGTIRTYQVKKVNQLESQNNNDKAYRRDSIHISSTPPENPDEQYSDNQEDDGTDVQDEHDQDEEETNSLSSITLETPRPRGPYPTYDRIQTNKIVFSQSPTRLAYDKEQRAQRLQEWEQQHPQIQQYHSDGSEIKTNKKQKKRVHFNTSPIGPTDVANPAQHKPLKPVLQQSTYKASYAPDHFQLRGYERLMTTAPSTTGSASTCGSVSTTLSLNKQDHQEHIAAFRNLFGYSYPPPFSPSSSSVSSRSLTSPATPMTPSKTLKKSRIPKNQKPSIRKRRITVGSKEDLKKDNIEHLNNEKYSIIRSQESLTDGYHSSEPADRRRYSRNYYGAASDTDIIKNDVKLRKRCTVVIRPTKELLQYERKRDELYNKILQKQRRKLELRALEKQREKERRRLSRREEKGDSADILNNEEAEKGVSTKPMDIKDSSQRRRRRNYNEIFMSSESEFETNFQVRTRKQKQQSVGEMLQPLKIQIATTDSTTSLLNAIDDHLDKPVTKVHEQKKELTQQREQDKRTEQKVLGDSINDKLNKKICNNTNDTGQTKMRELNLLADIAQHLSPYQLDIPENNNLPQSSPTPPSPPQSSSTPPSPPQSSSTPPPPQSLSTQPPQSSSTPPPQSSSTPPQSSSTSLPPPSPSPPPLPPVIEPTIPALKNPASENNDKSNICKDAGLQDKAIITEQLFIQSFDNLLEKPQQIDEDEKQQKQSQQEHEKDSQQEETDDYAHEPKLNVAAILNSSPVNLLQHPQTNTDKDNASNNARNEKITNSLEQILEESIKSVTSPFSNNNNNECNASKSAQTQIESTIPLLISNVESLNHLQHNSLTDSISSESDVDKKNEQPLLQNENNQLNTFMNKLANETKDVNEKDTNVDRPFTLMSTVEPSIISGDLSNVSSEIEISNNIKVSTLIPADLADIALESELSKHLPEVAEPSPVVTDMSDNSNESDISKSFSHNNSHQSHTTAIESTDIPMINLSDLPLVMPTIPPTSPPLHQQTQETSIPMSSSTTSQLENGLNPLNSSLNTPIKQPSLPDNDESCRTQSRADLITPLKFSLQSEMELDNTPLKGTLEPECDNNVTKFLDLILNKTVTDAESETRDKIIKELNALTEADTSATESPEQEEAELAMQEAETGGNCKTVDSDATVEDDDKEKPVQNVIDENNSLDSNKISKNKNAIDENLQNCKSNDNITGILENSKTSHKESNIEDYCNTSLENNSNTSFVNPNHKDAQSNSKDTFIIKNSEIYPANINSVNETSTLINAEQTSTKPNCETTNAKITLSPVKETFNIKCRVRLKRLTIVERSKSTKKDTWVAIPITKPEEPENASNNLSICDNNNKTETTTPLIKKPCLKYSSKRAEEELGRKFSEGFLEITEASAAKKPKLDVEDRNLVEKMETSKTEQQQQGTTSVSGVLLKNNNTSSTPKTKSKGSKTVTFDLSNLNENIKDNGCNHKQQKFKGHTGTHTAGGSGYYQKNSRSPRKLPDNTLRAAETLQIFVNTINDCARTQPPAEFNRKRSPIKNKCIAEDETPQPPLPPTLIGTQTCKKISTEKSRSQITSSKCKDQLVSSLTTPSISNITSDIATARIYTSSPLDQTLPEYDVDNVDTVADSELILPTNTGSLRRKHKKPKKTLTRPEPVDCVNSEDIISNQPECNADDDTDAVVDNEDDVFAEQLLPIPTANEHILEEIVSARPPHIGTGTVIRDDYMNIEATATVPVYLFNDESRDLATPEPIQSSDTNVVDSSSYLNTPSTENMSANALTTTTAIGNLEKSMLSPSEHEVSSTQETFYQTPTKSKQIDAFGEKSMANKDKLSCSSNAIKNQIKADDKTFQNKEDDQTSSTVGLLQNNQVDTTNHSPEMCTLTLTGSSSTNTTTTITNNRKNRKASTHDEILFNELQQQQQQLQLQQQQQHQQQKPLQQSRRKTMFCAESTSDSSNIVKNKIVSSNVDDIKTNGSMGKIEDKFKKLLKDGVNQSDNIEIVDNSSGGSLCVGNKSVGGGGSSPSTTTIINEEKSSKSKRKKSKSSKSEKSKHHERSTKIILKASKLTPHVPTNPLKITIPKSRLIKSPPTPTPPSTLNEELNKSITTNSSTDDKIAIDKETSSTMVQNKNNHCTLKADSASNCSSKSKHDHISELIDTKTIVLDSDKGKLVLTANVSIAAKDKEKANVNNLNIKNKPKTTHNTDNLPTTTNSTFSSTFTTTAANCSNKNDNGNSIFVKDKYDLIKNRDKHHHHLQENKEKSKGKFNNEVKKHDYHNKVITQECNNSATLHYKTSTKEKTREKHDKNRHKTLDKSLMTPPNVLKSVPQKTPSATLTATSSDVKLSSSSKSSKNKMHDIMNGTTSSTTTTVLKSKTNLSVSSQLSPLTSSAAGLATQINPTNSTTLTSSTSPISATISTNHVRKKLKTK